MLKAKDKEKDQSYFLWQLNQKQLSHILFPVGNYTKPEVRKLAKKFKLPTAQTPESQEVCFIQNTTNDFLRKYLKTKPGKILDAAGKALGQHQGLWFYTIGQRRGIGLSGGPYYVVAKDVTANTITVSNKKIQEGVNAREVVLSDTHFVSGEFPDTSKKYSARTRYRQPLALCSLQIKGGVASIVFDAPRELSAPGQSLVLYDGDVCLGGGIIV